MIAEEMFLSVVRSAGDIAGVFEYDGDTGYFYLYDTAGNSGAKVIDSLGVVLARPDFREPDVEVRWNDTETRVGLFIRNVLWAVFDVGLGVKFGGGYGTLSAPDIPAAVALGFH